MLFRVLDNLKKVFMHINKQIERPPSLSHQLNKWGTKLTTGRSFRKVSNIKFSVGNFFLKVASLFSGQQKAVALNKRVLRKQEGGAEVGSSIIECCKCCCMILGSLK